MYFYQALLRDLEMDRVRNVPASLVERHLHHGGERVSWNAERVWRGHLAVYRDFGSRYSERAREIFLLRARLKYCNTNEGMLGEFIRTSWHLARRNGREDARMILGEFLFRVPLFRASVVH
jgi:hypothetical protein